ncbi:hypothetical protein ACFYOF_06575 [Streptomyces sp. NPDC007148]|uniref:hypothetical protein n=1 Tax=Streptomyces sp. NPDC007148 TaxID=3364775 RepID=UPI0036B3956D
MRPSRRQLTERVADQAARLERTTAQRDEARRSAEESTRQLGRVAGELSAAKDIVASFIVAADHLPAATDAKSFAIALREAVDIAGVDIRLELARAEGASR